MDGEIVYISSMRGDQMVNVGDKVKAGQTLINGIIDRRKDDNYYLIRNAMGNIKARVEYTGQAMIRLDEVENS